MTKLGIYEKKVSYFVAFYVCNDHSIYPPGQTNRRGKRSAAFFVTFSHNEEKEAVFFETFFIRDPGKPNSVSNSVHCFSFVLITLFSYLDKQNDL